MNFPDLQNLSAYQGKIEIIRETAQQIQKDFELQEEKIEFGGIPELAFEELKAQIEPLIRRYLDLDAERFFRLMYRIDVDENQVKAILFDREDRDVAGDLCRIIIERELKKVIIRWHFRTSQDRP